jgi:hypothetical protein
VERNFPARKPFGLYNRKGIFGNSEDSLTDLETVLREHFADTEIRMEGCVALVSGRKKE